MLFRSALNTSGRNEQMRLYGEAIRLKPGFAEAFCNRGIARAAKADLAGALEDYGQAIRLKPGFAEAFCNQGIARAASGDLGACRG